MRGIARRAATIIAPTVRGIYATAPSGFRTTTEKFFADVPPESGGRFALRTNGFYLTRFWAAAYNAKEFACAERVRVEEKRV